MNMLRGTPLLDKEGWGVVGMLGLSSIAPPLTPPQPRRELLAQQIDPLAKILPM